MLDVLKKRWQTRGWRPMEPADSEPMALDWIETMDREHIPFQHYRELYFRSLQLRANRMEQGLECDDFSVEMMIACWPSLRQELKQKEIDAGRTLSANAESVCKWCLGTGWRNGDMNDPSKGVKRCDHSEPQGDMPF
jgi:hypothetical protein